MPHPTTFKNTISWVLHFSGIYRTGSVLCIVIHTKKLYPPAPNEEKSGEKSIGDNDTTINQCLNPQFLCKWL